MKRYFRLHVLTLSISIVFGFSLIAALLPFTQEIVNNSFMMGVPFSFFTVYVTENFEFATHLGIGGLLLDIAMMYIIGYSVENYVQMHGKK